MNDTTEVAKVSVVIPTIGRPTLLRGALISLARCNPAAAEVIVVDQSDSCVSGPVLDESGPTGARVVGSDKRGRAAAVNRGLAEASHRTVLITDDDCTVSSDWVGAGKRLMEEDPGGIVCGRVLPPSGEDPRLVPSTISLDTPIEYTDQVRCDVLYAGNMGCPRDEVLTMGGFDERIWVAAADCDFCYRWLRDGRRLRHDPGLVVWHHSWRAPRELKRHYVNYYRGSGLVYAKHLAAGDTTMLRFILRDCYGGLRSLAGPLKGRERWADPRSGVLAGLPRGLWEGWNVFSRGRRR